MGSIYHLLSDEQGTTRYKRHHNNKQRSATNDRHSVAEFEVMNLCEMIDAAVNGDYKYMLAMTNNRHLDLAIACAAENGRAKALSYLLAQSSTIDVASNDNRAFRLAQQNNHHETVMLLLQYLGPKIHKMKPITRGNRVIMKTIQIKLKHAINFAAISVSLYQQSYFMGDLPDEIKLFILTLAFGNDIIVCGKHYYSEFEFKHNAVCRILTLRE